MTTPNTGSDFGSALLDGLDAVADETVSVSDAECSALLAFARQAAANLRRSRLDLARVERERAQTLGRHDLSFFSLDALRERITNLLALNPALAVQHRHLEDLDREDLESLVSDLESLNAGPQGVKDD